MPMLNPKKSVANIEMTMRFALRFFGHFDGNDEIFVLFLFGFFLRVRLGRGRAARSVLPRSGCGGRGLGRIDDRLRRLRIVQSLDLVLQDAHFTFHLGNFRQKFEPFFLTGVAFGRGLLRGRRGRGRFRLRGGSRFRNDLAPVIS